MESTEKSLTSVNLSYFCWSRNKPVEIVWMAKRSWVKWEMWAWDKNVMVKLVKVALPCKPLCNPPLFHAISVSIMCFSQIPALFCTVAASSRKHMDEKSQEATAQSQIKTPANGDETFILSNGPDWATNMQKFTSVQSSVSPWAVNYWILDHTFLID